MNDLPAQHFLKIYRGRLSMAKRGVTSPPAEFVAQVRRLVAGLSAVAPSIAVRLDIEGTVRLGMEGKRVKFIAAETGELIGELDLDRRN